MAIDVQYENVIPIKDAPKHTPGRPHIATVNRWHIRGARGVRLETILVGGKRFTSIEAIQRFIDATTAAADGVATVEPPPSAAQQRKLDRLDRELAEAGL